MVLFYAVMCMLHQRGNPDIYVEIIYLKYIVKYLMLFRIINTYDFTVQQLHKLYMFYDIHKILPLQIS